MESSVKTPKFPKLEGILASRGLSYMTVSDGINMDIQSFRRRMNGSVNFSLDEIFRLCTFLNCNFSDIFDE